MFKKNVILTKKYMKTKFTLLLALSLICLLYSNSVLGCYAFVAGKKATVDGSVLVAHSEMNAPAPKYIDFFVMPRVYQTDGKRVIMPSGGSFDDVRESWSYLRSQNYGVNGSDGFLNEWGVAIVSDATPTREDDIDVCIKRGDIVNGGISFQIRIEVAKRAKTAREGLKIIGWLVEKFGSPGRGATLIVADPNEAWLVCVVRGKRWVAQRVPDDEVAVLANVISIREINLKDTMNFLGSKDIISYAIQRGWYDPKLGEPFDFKKAYEARSESVVSTSGGSCVVDFSKPGWFEQQYGVDPRQWRGICLVTGNDEPFPRDSILPFSVKPNRLLTVKDMRNFLSDHLEGTDFDKTEGYEKGSPHSVMHYYDGVICTKMSQEGAVFQLRSWLPREVANIYWRITAASCSGALTPWYSGITYTAPSYYRYSPLQTISEEFHFNPPHDAFQYDANKAFYIFNDLEFFLDMNYKVNIDTVRKTWNDLEEILFASQQDIEQIAVKLLVKDNAMGRAFLTNYSNAQAMLALEKAKGLVAHIRQRTTDY